MDMWKAEIMAKVETQEDRKARIMERAYALRDERERIRQHFVKDALDRQWRDACDDARTLDSEALLALMDQERKQQILDKTQRKSKLKSDEQKFNEEWMKYVSKIEEQEQLKDKNRLENELLNKDQLQQQVRIAY